ncbi:hypothetical protein HDV06_004687 [Boothiomyces sp. JEL0866]|nr:hypothetical protein HDV06_004687 [Boothiomyces sp. JEL0866]
MKMIVAALMTALVSAANVTYTYALCDPNNYPYKGMTVNVPFVQTGDSPNVSGNFTIIDGCTFAVTNFTFFGASASYFVGSMKDDPNGVKMSAQTITPSAFATNATFTLTKAAGVQVNFKMFNQVRIFDVEAKNVVATADLPAPPSSTGSTGSSNGVQGSAPSATTTSNDLKSVFSPVLLFASVLLL